jgi:uncharacterized protein YggE
MRLRFIPVLSAFAATLAAQIVTTGEATITAKPDEARFDIAVVTEAKTADAAAAQNAQRADAVLREVRKAAAGAEARTTGYSLSPGYRFPRPGGPAEIAGYTARNTIEVVTGDLASIGKLIDAALSSGANSIDRLRFTLKDEAKVRTQALAEASVKARRDAEAIAGALGLKAGKVVSVEESAGPPPIRPVMYEMARATGGAAPQTPVEPGNVEVRATVTLKVALE